MHYCEDGVSISDFEVESFISEISQMKSGEVRVSSDLGILAVRVAVIRGLLDASNIRLHAGGSIVRISDRGELESYSDFHFATDKLLDELLDYYFAKKKKEEKQSD